MKYFKESIEDGLKELEVNREEGLKSTQVKERLEKYGKNEFTTKEEIDYVLETLYNCIPMLRRYTRH